MAKSFVSNSVSSFSSFTASCGTQRERRQFMAKGKASDRFEATDVIVIYSASRRWWMDGGGSRPKVYAEMLRVVG